ncbi:Endoribonuclease L-PSP/chorismate mutase-like protein [Naematelia encephala]|uniref:Endoribonuclease L-PSP/chorismate mutase-like protein n=1 Tax=Naematelia encephala TaxID=71784 RepID=A0A1Y2BLQ4_9TREE|nr:Endoribonuclease L-PSP/chorismate mutase-like protein [Naematelia encephala]
MSREIISSEKYPEKPHNSPAVRVPGLVFCSGQVGKGPDIKAGTVEALSALKDVLELSGATLESVCKYNIFLKNMDDFVEMNKAFVAFLPDPKPARTCIQAGRLPGGPDSIIEIECIAQV